MRSVRFRRTDPSGSNSTEDGVVLGRDIQNTLVFVAACPHVRSVLKPWCHVAVAQSLGAGKDSSQS